jgi:hypothetical protein
MPCVDLTPVPPPEEEETVEGCPDPGGYLRVVNVSTKTQLDAAIATALPGDLIILAAGSYVYGSEGFKIHGKNGTMANPITICGPRTAILNAYLWMKSSWWVVRGFRIRGDSPNGQVWGVYQESGGNNRYLGLEVDHQNQEGIVIHNGPSFNNEIAYNFIHDVGQTRADRGEGIYIGDGNWDYVDDGSQQVDDTWIHHNTITNARSEGIELKSGTDGAIVEFNVITNAGHGLVVGSDAPIQVRANNNIIRDNTIVTSPRYGIELWVPAGRESAHGNGNTFQRNSFQGMANNKAFFIQAGHSGNVVCDDNTVTAPVVLNTTTTSCP